MCHCWLHLSVRVWAASNNIPSFVFFEPLVPVQSNVVLTHGVFRRLRYCVMLHSDQMIVWSHDRLCCCSLSALLTSWESWRDKRNMQREIIVTNVQDFNKLFVKLSFFYVMTKLPVSVSLWSHFDCLFFCVVYWQSKGPPGCWADSHGRRELQSSLRGGCSLKWPKCPTPGFVCLQKDHAAVRKRDDGTNIYNFNLLYTSF